MGLCTPTTRQRLRWCANTQRLCARQALWYESLASSDFFATPTRSSSNDRLVDCSTCSSFGRYVHAFSGGAGLKLMRVFLLFHLRVLFKMATSVDRGASALGDA